MFEQMCIDIKEREKELHAKAIELEKKSDELQQWAKELEEREKLVIIRELSSALHLRQPPEPKKRHFFKKGFHLFKSPHDKKIDIGPPSDFTHCITVQQDQHGKQSIDDINYGSNSNLPSSPHSTTATVLSGSQVTTPNHNLATPTLPMGTASPSLRLKVFLPGHNTELLNGNNSFNQIKRDKSLSNENSSDNQSGLSTPKQSHKNKTCHLSRQKTPKQTTIWYNDLRSNSLDSDMVFNEKKDDTNESHCSTMPYQNIHSYNHHNHSNKKIGKIFYEIGSFLGIVGLGKDYKKEIVGDAKPPIHSKMVRKSSSPNTLQRSKASLDVDNNKNSRDETPPSSLSRVNKTYPYRVKSSSGTKHKNKISKSQNDANNISSDAHSGSSSLQSSPKIQSSRIAIQTQSNSISRKQSSNMTSHHIISSLSTNTETNFHYTDDSGIYGDSRKELIDDEMRQRLGSLIRPGSLNIKSALEKSNVFQKRRDILTSSNSTEDDENASFKNDSVISQLINASNVMRDQMRILIDNGIDQQQKQRTSIARSNSKTSASSAQQPTPNEEFGLVNQEAHSKIKMLSKQLFKQQISKNSNNNEDAEDQNLQSTVL
jgi:hypothetical protein